MAKPAPLQPNNAMLFEVNTTENAVQYGIAVVAEQMLCVREHIYDFAVEIEHFRLSFEVLNVLERYGQHNNPKADSLIDPSSNKSVWVGKTNFLPHVYHFVRQRTPVLLTLPAFPCKSSNRVNKVLGHLPDFGEELALRRLHAMGKDIKKVYAPGAQVNIATDGVLFNDIIGVTDEDCWEYGEALKVMIAENHFTTLNIVPPMKLIGLSSFEENDWESYLATTELCREELENRFGSSDEAISAAILNDKDTELTYRGMLKFLESETETSLGLTGLGTSAKRRILKAKARKMIQRSEAFTLAIRMIRPLDVRLSMHPSSGAAKLSFPLIPSPEGNFQKSPWHSCIALGADGRLRCVHAREVRDTHDLIYRNGRPWLYCNRSLFERA